ncbi:MAG: 2Fe-2S iron-sulfur cluster binding domain-containing protein, partial [Nitrospira sp.]
MSKNSQRNVSSRLEPQASGPPSAMTVIINSHRITADPGDTIYQAAKKAGIVIPSLCTSDHLNPFGSCRLCLCEIEGQSGTPASCTTPVREGLVVQTDTSRLQRLRRNIVELYLSEQPAAGPVPEALQRLAVSSGVHAVRYQNPARRQAYCDESNPFFVFDNAACVSCA